MATKEYLDKTGLQRYHNGIKSKINEKAKITLTGVDPGEGASIPAGEYVAVYGEPDHRDLIDFFYPVGSYYETSDTSFNPNTAWGGTWVEDTAGRVLVAKDTSTFSTVGDTGGAEKHSHKYGLQYGAWYGSIALEGAPAGSAGVLIYDANGNITTSGGGAGVGQKTLTLNNSAAGATKSNSISAARMIGDSEYKSTLQPYIVVRRWHRTA